MTEGSHPVRSSPRGPRPPQPTLPAGASAVRLPSGLEVVDVETGDGRTAEVGRTIRVHYRAWLAEGALVDDTEQRDAPLEFTIGDEEPIPALEEGVEGMKVGGRRRLIAPSDLAYGPDGHGAAVPPYATLILDVELIAVR